MISNQLDIRLVQFTEAELDAVFKKNQNRKAAGLNKIPPEVWKTRTFDDILLQLRNAVNEQNTKENGRKVTSFPSLRKVTSESLRTTEV